MSTTINTKLVFALTAGTLLTALGAEASAQNRRIVVNHQFSKQVPIGSHNGAPLVNVGFDVPLNAILNLGNNNKSGIITGGGSMGFGGDTSIYQGQSMPFRPAPHPGYGRPVPSPYTPQPAMPYYPGPSQSAGAMGNGNVLISPTSYPAYPSAPRPMPMPVVRY